jgi:hypothetical protein
MHMYSSVQFNMQDEKKQDKKKDKKGKKNWISASGNRTLVSRELQVHGTH